LKNLNKEILQIMKKYNVTVNKSYGQNFLIDEKIVEEIIEKSNISKKHFIIEIGPGLGTLTKYLLQNAGKVIAIELDKKMVNIISDRFSNEIENNNSERISENATIKINNTLEILCQDILKVNLKKIIDKELNNGYKKVKIVANLPYYITTPIIMKLLEEKLPLESITVMVQKEVAERLAEIPGGKETGTITYTVYYYTDANIIINVPKDSFIPEPEVNSAVIQFKLLENPRVSIDNEDAFFKLIKQSFLMKRKTLVNALAGFQNKTKQDIIKMQNELGIDDRVRAEQLSIEDFVRIWKKLAMD